MTPYNVQLPSLPSEPDHYLVRQMDPHSSLMMSDGGQGCVRAHFDVGRVFALSVLQNESQKSY